MIWCPAVWDCPTLASPLIKSIFRWLSGAQVWFVWSNKGALGQQELRTLLGCCSVPALL